MKLLSFVASALALAGAAYATVTDPRVLDKCPGYKASHVVTKGATLTADLALAGKACNVFGKDIASLKLQVTYETSKWLSSCWQRPLTFVQLNASTSRLRMPRPLAMRFQTLLFLARRPTPP